MLDIQSSPNISYLKKYCIRNVLQETDSVSAVCDRVVPILCEKEGMQMIQLKYQFVCISGWKRYLSANFFFLQCRRTFHAS